jgi:hypothetical protein
MVILIMGNYVTHNISLTPFSMENVFYFGLEYMTKQNLDWPKTLDLFLNNDSLVCLFYQTMQVPRLVLLALEALCESRNQSFMASCSIFESKILKWYGDASRCFELHSVNELVHIIFVCACGYQLSPYNTIPNTDLVVGDLVDGGIIFHYGDNRYNTLLLTFSKERRKEILQYSKSLISGVDLSKCFFSFDSWLNKSLDLYAIGIEFELIFSHCLCIKYYLHSLVKKSNGPFPLTDVYELDQRSTSYNAASNMMIDLRNGYKATTEKQAEDELEEFLYHNVLTNNAIADCVVYKHPSPHLHIQCKYSFDQTIDTGKVACQLSHSQFLLWVQLGIIEDEFVPPSFKNSIVKKAWDEKRLVFIDGSGCCSQLIIDLFILLKSHLKTIRKRVLEQSEN